MGELWPKGSGSSGAQITISAYGSGALPIIDAQGQDSTAAIRLSDQEYWTISNIEATNWATSQAHRWGIYIHTTGSAVTHGITISNNVVRDVYASYTRTRDSGHSFYDVGGIYVLADEPGSMDNVLIEGNSLYDIVGIGISFWGENEWTGGGMDWGNLSTNVVVRNNTVRRTAADGILMLGVDDVLVERNFVDSAGQLGTSATEYIAGLWPTRHRNGIIQHNEVSHTKKWTGDGQAFDYDLAATGSTIYQYNYSHDNEGGFFLDCCEPENTNTGAILRYNISQNDGPSLYLHLLKGNVKFYNNVFYTTGAITMLGTSNNTFTNNIFYGSSASWNGNSLDNNAYYGGLAAPTSDGNKKTDNPQFDSAGTGGNGLNSVDGYKLQSSSPCIGTGAIISDNGGFDYWGNQVTQSDIPNVGAYGVLRPAYTPVPTSIEIEGPILVRIPVAGTTTASFTATVKDQYGLTIGGQTIGWTLNPAVSGVSIDSVTGVLSVSSEVSPRNIDIVALSGPLYDTLNVSMRSFYYKYSLDYSSQQGPQWFYEFETGGAYTPMTWVSSDSRWRGNETYLLLWEGGFHPGVSSNSALKWVAPKDGTISISGTVSKSDVSGGDGIIATIKKGSETVWGSTSIEWNDATGQSHDLTTTVNAGDAIYFIGNKNSSDGNDGSSWDPEIVYTQTTAIEQTTLSILSASLSARHCTGGHGARLQFALDGSSHVVLTVYGLNGANIRTMPCGVLSTGLHTIVWNGMDNAGRVLPNGFYYVKLACEGRNEVVRVTLMN